MLVKLSLEDVQRDFVAFLAARGTISGSNHGDAAPANSDAAGLEDLWRTGLVAARDLADAVADFHALPRTTFAAVSERPPLFQDLSRRFLKEAFVYPFEDEGDPALAVADPTRRDAIQAVCIALGQQPPILVLSFEEVELLFERAGAESAAAHAATESAAADTAPAFDVPDTVEALQDLARGAPIVRTIDQLLERALEIGATDIHLETGREQLKVRFRVDGYLRHDRALPKHLAPAIISRVKILASLDIAERRLPQDGRAGIRIGNTEADLRVAIMPTMYGETAVLRVLVKDARLLEFGRIGMSPKDQRAFEDLLKNPHGIVIVTGPTGSGKTTTLATAIQALNDPARKIVTVEDPIEYQIPGVHQTQVKPTIGLTFASALRSFLRHDPDVIMVGEIRDRETAGIGIQAALTGHLVLTTLHTNNAADAVVRLADMGVEPYLIRSSLRGVLGQRLVRRLCERCRQPSPQVADTAREMCAARGIAVDAGAVYHEPGGCEACGNTGYRGRLGIFEVMRVDDALQASMRQHLDPQALVEAARRSGMTTMLEDGLAKAGRGLTSMAEVIRATG